jgi:hypothetical protein
MKKLSLGIILLSFTLTSCGDTENPFSIVENTVRFMSADKQVMVNKNASYAEKRGFNDFTGDGIEDMIEIEDEKFFGQDYKVRIFPGMKNKDGLLAFDDPYKVDLKLKYSWFSSYTKMDTADVNGDGAADIIFSTYKDNAFKEDQYFIAIGINQGDGKNFVFKEKIEVKDAKTSNSYFKSMDMQYFLINYSSSLYSTYGGHGESIRDYLKIDWADINGDKKDDFVMFWRTSSYDVHVSVVYSSAKGNSLTFNGAETFELEDFVSGDYAFKAIDVEDFNGDGFQDIINWYAGMGDSITFKVALNTKKFSKKLFFIQEPEFESTEIDNFKTFGFEKRDTLDLNMDGCADYLHIGRIKDSQPAYSYNLVDCDRAKSYLNLVDEKIKSIDPIILKELEESYE